MKIKAIALNTVREAIKDRILYLLLFFAVISFLFSRILSLLTAGDEGRSAQGGEEASAAA